MGRGRAWTEREDDLVREAARETSRAGLTVVDDAGVVRRAARLADVARQIGRTRAAVEARAVRIGAVSYPRRRSGRKGAER